MRSMQEIKCRYIFSIYTNKACKVLPPGSLPLFNTGKSSSLIGSIFSFYYSIFAFGLGIIYYLIVAFVIFCIYKVISTKMENPSADIVKSVPYTERITYYFYRLKSYILG